MNSHSGLVRPGYGRPGVNARIPLDETVDGKMGIVDGSGGVIYVDPDEETLARMRKAQEEENPDCYTQDRQSLQICP